MHRQHSSKVSDSKFDYRLGINQFEALTIRKETGTIADIIFVEGFFTGREWEKHKQIFPCWMGTFIIYEEPDKPLGRHVVFTNDKPKYSLTYSVPEDYRGLANVAIVLRHPNLSCEMKREGEFQIMGDIFDLVHNFPKENGWYARDQRTGVPYGLRVPFTQMDARYLTRRKALIRSEVDSDGNSECKSAYVTYMGFTMQPGEGVMTCGRYVHADLDHDRKYAVVLI